MKVNGMSKYNVNDMKWSVKDREYGDGVVNVTRLYDDDGVPMCEWDLTLPVFPYGLHYSEQTVESFEQYLKESDAEVHWTRYA